MNIKSLLIGSAAALAAVSGAQAADAIVAAEPEPMEYVRVCDAFGTGFFYIPGTETCLKFGGYVRFQTNVGRDEFNTGRGTSDWDSFTRAQFEVDARSDTELGTLRGFIGLQANGDNAADSGMFVEQAFIELGGLKVGKFFSWWDDGINGETDKLSSNALFNSVRYTFDAGSFTAGISVDELEGIAKKLGETDNNIGVAGNIGFKVGGVSGALLGSYDIDNDEGAVRGMFSADLGPGALNLAGVWASGYNSYYNRAEWSAAASYAIKATDRLTITPGVQYDDSVRLAGSSVFSNLDSWRAGVTVDYKITEGLTTKITANYVDTDVVGDTVEGFFRLQRSF